MRRTVRWIAAVATVVAGTGLLPAETQPVWLVPWKVFDGSERANAPLVLYWAPASRDELRHSELLTSPELTLYASRCVAMRVVRVEDIRLVADEATPAPFAMLHDDRAHLLRHVEGHDGTLEAEAVEAMVREELESRAANADAMLDRARELAASGEPEAAAVLYQKVWDQRCTFPRQAKDAQRALRKLRR
jgi:hypothetical protein